MIVSHATQVTQPNNPSKPVSKNAWNANHTIDPDIEVNEQTGTSYALVAADNGKIVTLTNGSAIALTVPADLGLGFNCLLMQGGAGQVTVTGSGATVNSRGGATKLNGQYAVGSLVAYVANTFVLAGDVTT